MCKKLLVLNTGFKIIPCVKILIRHTQMVVIDMKRIKIANELGSESTCVDENHENSF